MLKILNTCLGFADKVLNEIILNYLHRQECLCYGIKSGFGSTDIPVCVPRYYRPDAYYHNYWKNVQEKIYCNTPVIIVILIQLVMVYQGMQKGHCHNEHAREQDPSAVQADF